jgi:hypothetical protein
MTQLRAIGQGCGVPLDLSMDEAHLIQAIEAKMKEMVPAPAIEVEKPQYDARLMTKPPAKICTEERLIELLEPYIAIGLHLDFPAPERWRMRYDKREDSGTMRQPPRVVLKCAERLMR